MQFIAVPTIHNYGAFFLLTSAVESTTVNNFLLDNYYTNLFGYLYKVEFLKWIVIYYNIFLRILLFKVSVLLNY